METDRISELRLAQARRTLLLLVQAVRDDSMDLAEAAAGLSQLRHRFVGDQRDADFDLFLLIASETDHILIGEARKYYSAEALKRARNETREARHFYREYLTAACENLLRRFGEPGSPSPAAERGA